MAEEKKGEFTVCEGLVIKAAKIRTAIDKASEASLENAKESFEKIKHNKKLYNQAIKEATFPSIYSPAKDEKGKAIAAKDRKLLYTSLSAIDNPALKSAVLDALKEKING
tara:strand:+ start:377 stop:706 length:330 start_codon:yes stop_codon:yes gene_type:complete